MIDKIKSTFLKEENRCYFCGDAIHNFTTEKLFDGRVVISCYDCYKSIEEGKKLYYAKTNGTTNQ